MKDLLTCDSLTFKQVLRIVSYVEASNIGDVNKNNTITDKIVDYLYAELSDNNTRNNEYYKQLNALLCLNYALCMSVTAKSNGVNQLYSFSDIKEFAEEYLSNITSIVNPLNSLLLRDDVSIWNNYLGYNAKTQTVFEEYDSTIDTVFNITSNEIKRLFPEYPFIYAKSISNTYSAPNLKKALFDYENALRKSLERMNFDYVIGDRKSRTIFQEYMFYYLGFNVIRYNKKGKIEFKYDSGVINEECCDFLTKLEKSKSKQDTVYSLIRKLNNFVFLGDSENKSLFEITVEEVIGNTIEISKLMNNNKESDKLLSKMIDHDVNYFGLATLEYALNLQQQMNNDVSGHNEKDRALLNSIVLQCLKKLEKLSFINKFGEYLLI